jgi:putative ABC transport system permease protein
LRHCSSFVFLIFLYCTVIALLKTFSWQELRHHPWRNAAAMVAVMLGVALAFSVHLINESALDEFSQAARSVNGQPDLELRSAQGAFDEALYARIAQHPDVLIASPVLELTTQTVDRNGASMALRVLGVDALLVARVAPALMPQPDNNGERLTLFAPDTLFLNPAAQQRLGLKPLLQVALTLKTARVAGQVSAGGAPLAVMDLGAAQDFFNQGGQLSRIDLKLRPGVTPAGFVQVLQATPDWPRDVLALEPGDRTSQINALSRAYRVNLTVLALIALFTGAFLVFSVLALSVSKRSQQLALLGVLGLSARQRLALVLWEALALGLVGSALGLALGTALAALALRILGGDLGGGYFAGVAPTLQWSAWAALLYGALGVAAALVGAWWPARQAQQLPLASTLKGLGGGVTAGRGHWISLFFIAAGALLAWAPPVFGIPLAAYISVGCLLVGGIGALPWLIALMLDRLAPLLARQTLPLLAVERARRQRETAAVAVSGVVASLSLAVALTVMVASFRDSVTQWLDRVLPADLYVRSANSSGASDTVYFTPKLVQSLAKLDGVTRLETQRQMSLRLRPTQAPVALIARPLEDPARRLPLVSGPLSVPAGHTAIYVSEAMVDLFDARPGTSFAPLSASFPALALDGHAQRASFFVAGVWRDYARQSGTIAIDKDDFERLTGDTRTNDIAFWLADPSDIVRVEGAVRTQVDAQGPGTGQLLDFGSAAQIRATSLRIFDRSFAITYWLQAVAIGIGLFGVAASFSAQVFSRRKEFGLLAHLGLTRQQVLSVVAMEGMAWTTLGALAGLLLGLAVSVILVKVVNPQSFHWTMDLMVPWARLLLLCLAVTLAGTVTAWLSVRAAAGKSAISAVKEDW